MWAGVTLGRWLGAFGFVYIYSHWSSKNSQETKDVPAAWSVPAGGRLHPPTCVSSAHAISFGYRKHLSAGAGLDARATRGASAPRGRQLIACFSQEGKGLWVCRVHIEGLCLRNCTPSLPATCARHHAPTARPPHLLPLCATTLLFTPNSSLIWLVPLKILARTSRVTLINRGRYVIGKLHACFFLGSFFLSRKSNRHFPWADAVTSMRRGPLRNLWISKWCYIRAALIRAGLAKHTKTGYSAQHIPTKPPTSDDNIKHRTSLLLIPSFQSCFFYIHVKEIGWWKSVIICNDLKGTGYLNTVVLNAHKCLRKNPPKI